MKRIYFLLFILSASILSAQCPPGEVTLNSQADVDNFILTFPNCTQVTGDLNISGNAIVNLNGLANIVSVTGAVDIEQNPNLTNLNGLNNLSHAGIGLIIRDNSQLQNLDALANLTTIAGELIIRSCPQLTNLDGLSGLISTGTDLVIRDNASLTSVSGLSALTTVGGEFTVRSCPSLGSLSGMENLTSVGLGLIVRDCATLTTVEALSGVTYVGEILELVDLPQLSSLLGLQNITTIVGGDEGALIIEGNNALTSLEGLGNNETTITGGIAISTNNALSYCNVPAICKLLLNPPTDAIIAIDTNVTGCNSVEEVGLICTPIPEVTGFWPESGETGTTVTITGNDFYHITGVTVGGFPVVAFTVVSPTQIIAVLGAHATGPVVVANTTGAAQSTQPFIVTTLGKAGFAINEISIAPNPVTDVFQIKTTDTVLMVQLFDLCGQLVYAANPLAENVSVDMSRFAPGTYIVKISGDTASHTARILKF
ncbi:MAG TPA: T9SS type A sorting domain-containing protein [Flavobacterium sp.]|jgi:hypothetical protein